MAQYAIITTNKGVMKAELYSAETPKTVENFIKLAKEGFYNGLHFHRVLRGFVIQTGCPNSREIGDRSAGMGDAGYTIPCETEAERQYHDRGVLSMAHRGKDTGSSQFFICYNREQCQHLDGMHTAFGCVVEGQDVIDKIKKWDELTSVEIVEE